MGMNFSGVVTTSQADLVPSIDESGPQFLHLPNGDNHSFLS